MVVQRRVENESACESGPLSFDGLSNNVVVLAILTSFRSSSPRKVTSVTRNGASVPRGPGLFCCRGSFKARFYK